MKYIHKTQGQHGVSAENGSCSVPEKRVQLRIPTLGGRSGHGLPLPKEFRTSHGQLEIMGLVVIVILISLALLFVIQFVILRAPGQAKETFTQEQIAANTANALLLTTTACQGLDVTELIQDCAGFQDVSCDGQNSCAFVDGLAEDILRRTLKEWGKNYNLTVMSGTQELVGVAHQGCKGARDVSVYPIPSRVIGGDKIFVRLEVCG